MVMFEWRRIILGIHGVLGNHGDMFTCVYGKKVDYTIKTYFQYSI